MLSLTKINSCAQIRIILEQKMNKTIICHHMISGFFHENELLWTCNYTLLILMHDILKKLLYKIKHSFITFLAREWVIFNKTLQSDWVWGKPNFSCSPTQSIQEYSKMSHWNDINVANINYFRVPILWNLNLWQALAMTCTHVKPFIVKGS